MKKILEKGGLVIGITIFCLVIILMIWQLKPKSTEILVSQNVGTLQKASAAINTPTAVQMSLNPKPVAQLPTLAPSLRGTEVDCSLAINQEKQLILTTGIRNCFDYFLSSLGEKTESQLVADIDLYLNTVLPPTASPYALQLLDKYMAYRHASQQQSLKFTKIEKITPEVLEGILYRVKNLRQQFFTPPEEEAFFGNEDAYTQYTIAEMKINADSSLSAAQKAEQIADLIARQPPELAKSMKSLMQYAEIQKLTKQIQAQGGSPEELRKMRVNLVGEAAADRLAVLDANNAIWQKQVNSYLAAREQINVSVADPQARQREIDSLRASMFNTPEQQLRVQTYEQMSLKRN